MAPRTKKEKPTEIVALTPTAVGSTDLSAVMKEEASKRQLITQYISKHMKSGTDFGTIKFGNKESKPSLFKPGSEKFLSLFKLTARFEKDSDTWDMAGSEAGTFTYKCLLYATNGTIVGEGRGVSKLSEKQGWTINNAVKIAEKRAQIDAVLRTGALSDFFTQDLEDMAQTYDTSEIPDKAVPVVTYDDPEDATSQRKKIFALLKEKGVDVKDREACQQYVADETGLSLVEGNFAAIINTLTK